MKFKKKKFGGGVVWGVGGRGRVGGGGVRVDVSEVEVFGKIHKKKIFFFGGGVGGVGGWFGGGSGWLGGQGGCKRRIEVFVKIQQKYLFFIFGGGGGRGVRWWVGLVGWVR